MVPLLLLTACASVRPGPVALAPGAYELPVVNRDIEPAPGKDSGALLTEIIVPPSDKPTTVQVYKHRRALFSPKGAARTSIVASNPAAAAAQPDRWPWWWKALAILAGLAVVRIAWLKVSGPVKLFFEGARALLIRIIRRG